MTLKDRVRSLFDVEKYGAGVPTGLLLLGLALLIYAIRGLYLYDTLTVYGKVGVVTIFAAAIVTLTGAASLYRKMNVDVWRADRSVKDGRDTEARRDG